MCTASPASRSSIAATEATIGAAKRYTAPQISATDVVLADTSAQQFIQSETFAALVKDPNSLRLLSNPAMRG